MDVRGVVDGYRHDEVTGAVVERGLRLRSRVDAPASAAEVAHAGRRHVPAEVVELWQAAREAWLFEDVDYGQWGLHLLSPGDSAERTAWEMRERPRDVRYDDVVVGGFLGDQERLVFAPSEAVGKVVVALPIEPRADWHRVAPSLARFLRAFHDNAGEKFWEP